MSDHDREFEARARAAFDESVAALDGHTRSRLTQARHRALAARGARPAWQSLGLPVGAAAAAVLAVTLWTPGESPSPPASLAAAGPAEMLELFAAGDDFELLAEDPEFYAWAASVADVG